MDLLTRSARDSAPYRLAATRRQTMLPAERGELDYGEFIRKSC